MTGAAQHARIIYFRVVEPDYPRNRRIREYLRARGHEVVVVPPAEHHGRWLNHCIDLARLFRASRRGDVVLIAEQYVRMAPIAAVVAAVRGCRLVVDAFVGIHETAVEDWAVARPGSLRARRFRLQDRFARAVADCLLIDTDVRAEELRAAGSRTTVLTLPVGAPDWARTLPMPTATGPLRVLYYGNYIPLHGLDVVLDAISRCERPVTLTLVGDGPRRAAVERRLEEPALAGRLQFNDPVPERDLPGVIADHHVLLGVFGSSHKAETVIANKVWQGLACGRPVVTRESPALDELTPMVGTQLIQVTPAPDELARVLDSIDPSEIRAREDVDLAMERYTVGRFDALDAWLSSGTRS